MIATCDLKTCGISASEFIFGEQEISFSIWSGDKKASQYVDLKDVEDIAELCSRYDENIEYAGSEERPLCRERIP